MRHSLLSVCLTLLVLGGGSFLLWQRQSNRSHSNASTPAPLPPPASEEAPVIDLTRRTLDQIPVGAIIGKSPPPGWSHLVLITIPTLVPEDERDAPRIATHYARMFKFTILANVVPRESAARRSFDLEKVARGFAMTIKNQETIVNGQNTLGGDLGMFGKLILQENESILNNEVHQIARTRTMLIFDAQSVMLRGTDHVNMIMRHALLVDPPTGRLYTLVWLLTRSYEPAEDVLQLLPEGMWEKRLLSVKRDKFNFAGIPSREAFALRRVPPGTPVPYTLQLKEAATAREFSEVSVLRLEELLRAAAIEAAGH